MTKYLILEARRFTVVGGTTTEAQSVEAWVEAAEGVEASSAKGAIRKHVGSLALEPGGVTVNDSTFVAIPVRSFQPHSAKVEVQQRLIVG